MKLLDTLKYPLYIICCCAFSIKLYGMTESWWWSVVTFAIVGWCVFAVCNDWEEI